MAKPCNLIRSVVLLLMLVLVHSRRCMERELSPNRLWEIPPCWDSPVFAPAPSLRQVCSVCSQAYLHGCRHRGRVVCGVPRGRAPCLLLPYEEDINFEACYKLCAANSLIKLRTRTTDSVIAILFETADMQNDFTRIASVARFDRPRRLRIVPVRKRGQSRNPAT
jgi:hypothetical protein